MKITIAGRLPGMNEYTAACRKNAYAGAGMKKKYQDMIEWTIMSQWNHTQPELPVRIHFAFYEENRRRDMDNVAGFAHKVILDALVARKVIPDDGWNEISGFSDDFAVDKKNPRIEVEITHDLL